VRVVRGCGLYDGNALCFVVRSVRRVGLGLHDQNYLGWKPRVFITPCERKQDGHDASTSSKL
jgi:hypothetical protein